MTLIRKALTFLSILSASSMAVIYVWQVALNKKDWEICLENSGGAANQLLTVSEMPFLDLLSIVLAVPTLTKVVILTLIILPFLPIIWGIVESRKQRSLWALGLLLVALNLALWWLLGDGISHQCDRKGTGTEFFFLLVVPIFLITTATLTTAIMALLDGRKNI